jgi:O-antigen/teichoic acid export membrane protein
MSRSRPFTQSIALALLTQAVIMLAGLWLTPFLIHRLGTYQFGLWIVAQQLITYLTLLDFGVVALLPRETAYAAAVPQNVQRLLARTIRVVLLQTPIVALVGLIACALIPQRLHEFRMPAAAAASVFALLFPVRIFRALLEGLQDLAFTGWSSLVGWLAGFLVTIALLLHGFGLLALAGCWFAAQSSEAVLCFSRVMLRHRHMLPSKADLLESVPLRRQLGRGAWVSVSQIAQVLIYGTDVAIVGRLFGAAAIVPYNCTGKLIAVLANQPQHIMRAAEPGLSQMRVQDGREKLTAVTGALTLAMLLVSGLVTVVTVAANPSFVSWWVGPGLYSGAILTALFALSMLLRHLNITAIYTLFAFGHERFLARTSLLDGVLSTLLSVAFALGLHSVAGVILGSIVSTSCVFLFCNGRVLARELHVPLRKLAQPWNGWLWRMIVAACGAHLLSRAFTYPGIWTIAAAAALSAIGYILLMFPVAMRSALKPYLRFPINRRPKAGDRRDAPDRSCPTGPSPITAANQG